MDLSNQYVVLTMDEQANSRELQKLVVGCLVVPDI